MCSLHLNHNDPTPDDQHQQSSCLPPTWRGIPISTCLTPHQPSTPVRCRADPPRPLVGDHFRGCWAPRAATRSIPSSLHQARSISFMLMADMIAYSSNHDDQVLLSYIRHKVQTSQFGTLATRGHDTSAGNLPNTTRMSNEYCVSYTNRAIAQSPKPAHITPQWWGVMCVWVYMR